MKRWSGLALLFPLLMVIFAGCGGNSTAPATATPRPTLIQPSPGIGFTTSSLSIHLAYLRARSFTPDKHLVIPLAGGHTLLAVHSLCTGSADGHCQAVDAFLDDRSAPIFDRQYSAVQSLRRIANGFVVTASSYRTGDPLCCPSGPTVHDRYIWSSGHLTEYGPLPRDPSG